MLEVVFDWMHSDWSRRIWVREFRRAQAPLGTLPDVMEDRTDFTTLLGAPKMPVYDPCASPENQRGTIRRATVIAQACSAMIDRVVFKAITRSVRSGSLSPNFSRSKDS